MSKRRGRERWRAEKKPRCLTFATGAFGLSVDADTGQVVAFGQDSIEVWERDELTAVALELVAKAGWWRYPLDVRDEIWEVS